MNSVRSKVMVGSSDGKTIVYSDGKRPCIVVVCLTRPMERKERGSLQFSVLWGTPISTTRIWSRWDT